MLVARTCTNGAAAMWACGAGKAGGGGGEVCTSSRPPCAAPATLLLAPAELPAAAARHSHMSAHILSVGVGEALS